MSLTTRRPIPEEGISLVRRRVLLLVLVLCALLPFLAVSAVSDPAPPRPAAAVRLSTSTTPATRRVAGSTSSTSTSTSSSTTTSTTIDWQALAQLDYHSWSDWPIWHALGICEQGGWSSEGDGIAWHGQPAGGSASSAYPGGLGMSVDAWNAYRVAAGVSVAVGAYASPADQIRVGREEVRQIGGYRGWASGTLACMRSRFGIDVN